MRVDTAVLKATVQEILSLYFGATCTLTHFTRKEAWYLSSVLLEELEVRLTDGRALTIIFKDLCIEALTVDGKLAKPSFLHNPYREIEAYNHLTPHIPHAAQCYGAVCQNGRYWLFLEKINGRELHHFALDIWADVACWLAQMHLVLPKWAPPQTDFLVYDKDYFALWPKRASQFLSKSKTAESLVYFNQLISRYDQVLHRLDSLPRTIIHGEFYAANILIRENTLELQVCPIDWEMVGEGPSLFDLAALIAGKWTEEEKRYMASAYYEVMVQNGAWSPNDGDFYTAVDYCRLHVAMQWLGWAEHWTPPAEQAQNWLAEAIRVGKHLGLIAQHGGQFDA